MEPIQGEAGVIIPLSGYLKDVKASCEKHDIILILDEIQTGLGRTGKLLAEEHEDIEAAVQFVRKTGKRAVIASIEDIENAVKGESGTEIVN